MFQNSTHQGIASPQRTPVAWVVAASVALVALGAAAILWAHYGTAIFFSMIASGIAACF